MGLEYWDILDYNRKPTGRTHLRGERLGRGEYHLVVHIWVRHPDGRYLIQKRAAHLAIMPGVWAATGGSALAGEDSLTAARRELREELGIDAPADRMRLKGSLRREDTFCDIWEVTLDVDPAALRLQTEEVAQARWATREEILRMRRMGQFHRYREDYMRVVFGPSAIG